MSDIRTKTGLDYMNFTTTGQLNNENLHNKKNVRVVTFPHNVSEVSESLEKCRKCQTVEQGLDFMLWHFIEPLWPRNVSTAVTKNYQKIVDYRDRAILHYEGALRADCRISCYANYEELAKRGLIAQEFRPKVSHLFMELDLVNFNGDKNKLDLVLQKTLRNMSREMKGAVPTVLWSGGGYHIHQPFDPEVMPLYEEMPEFRRYDTEPSVKFMRYAERVLTNGKCDRKHNVSFRSAMARIPGSKNTKYEGDRAEVRVIQAWDGIRARPRVQFIRSEFLIWLAQAEIEAKERLRKTIQQQFNSKRSSYIYCNEHNNNITAWIEKLLQTPIADDRQVTRDLVIVPYLIVRKGMTDVGEIEAVVMRWADMCNEIEPLRPSYRGFVQDLRYRIKVVMREMKPPKSWGTFQEENSELAQRLREREG